MEVSFFVLMDIYIDHGRSARAYVMDCWEPRIEDNGICHGDDGSRGCGVGILDFFLLEGFERLVVGISSGFAPEAIINLEFLLR
jgi:hypothetical protein